jgi:hypothetical protein
MKIKTFKVIFACALAVTFSACNNNDPKPESKKNEDEMKQVIAFRNEISFIQNSMFNNLSGLENSGGRKSIRKNILQKIEAYTQCAEPLKEDPETLVVIMNFGDGCENEEGVVLKGKVELTMNFKDDLITFSTRYTDYQEIYENESESLITNGECSGTIEITPSFIFYMQNYIQNLRFTNKAGANASLTLSQKIEATDEEISFTELTLEGSLFNGDTFKSKLVQPLIYKTSCDSEFPIQGIEVLTFNNNHMEINYGNGTCDNDYLIIQ